MGLPNQLVLNKPVCSGSMSVVSHRAHSQNAAMNFKYSICPMSAARLDRQAGGEWILVLRSKAGRSTGDSGCRWRGARVGARNTYMGQGLGLRHRGSHGSRWSAGTWLDSKARVDADIPVSEAWDLWNDRENVPRWMEWIDTVKVSKQKPDFSKWMLRYKAFGRDFEFSWLAKNLEPVHHQKIHWTSVDGLPNRGAVHFSPQGTTACTVELTISYELPDIVAPIGMAVSPVVERVLQQDLNRFAKYVKSNRLSRV